ncbi:hypothetical protein HanXRQr2_Chr03g0094951 [Helianthus annuus]|uniref:Uncharacterized protein n=1 Tax=Helianthus annuus TaxID=4232 RepID=A0A251V903_HELAN|nr:hypothetical protein HanXRQr2_Chr03g0094951 [Helianthus annuus]KAJ0942406.1 hypothetical protein HanPSC8_Chr03g0091561 [Helianthus annuus]
MGMDRHQTTLDYVVAQQIFWEILFRDALRELKDLARYGTFSRCTSYEVIQVKGCDFFLDESQFLNCV